MVCVCVCVCARACVCVYTQWNTNWQRENGIMPCATTWMKLEGIMLSEISQSEKDRYHMFSLIRGC